jgi:hypothetical protein
MIKKVKAGYKVTSEKGKKSGRAVQDEGRGGKAVAARGVFQASRHKLIILRPRQRDGISDALCLSAWCARTDA